ncbi:hypothetical protein CCU68_00300 [Pseudomonas gingeri NCPPB 3146 = LMG 5327]|uniref:Lipoprotein n=2 Tax=Pseudomonas gingeri TaxID=117681 RepID=A0A7Y7XTN1_9PSED|nr:MULTISPECIES: hypothetical protein [Pseudomonas]NVZ28139.1 hypothetical protein [Pseudomonas gingeri]NVZ61743.1 hypothetical protein [Pseudomonas gingeri]NVZ77786.1 hypothetical protein [Pseudomonas gingeri]NWA09348.1 hypothetical protein [Pseudomonas gingeri]NWC12084.1 hypothetical protein [Pseudomonas gingeri]
MSKLIAVFALALLAGCTTNAKTHVRHGVSGIEIDCSGLGSGWEKCYKRAARECKAQGYKVVTKSSDAKDDEGDYLFGWNPAGYATRTMLVICN